MSRAVSPTTRRVFAAGVMVQVGIVVTGGLVRLTGSGLGCPTWPECTPGSYTPTLEQAEGFHSAIEFGNRLLAFVVGAVALACVVAAWRHRPRRRPLVLLAGAQLLGVLGQAGLGGVTVLTGLSPVIVAAHFLLSMVLIALAVALYLRGNEPADGPAVPLVRDEVRWLARGLAAVAAAVLVLGTVVTGSGPHSGDAQAPARLGLDPETMSWLHADLVFLFIGLIVALLVALRVSDGPAAARRRTRWLLGIALAQGVVGYVQYFTGLPEAVVALHMLGACLVVVATVAVCLSLRTRIPAEPDVPLESHGSPAARASSPA